LIYTNLNRTLLAQNLGPEIMSDVAKIFINGRSQAVRLPLAYRFGTKEVFIRKDPETGDIILSAKPDSWDTFFVAQAAAVVPQSFLSQAERPKAEKPRDPFEGWTE